MARTPHISELTLEVMFPDKFLKAAHLQGHTPIVTIEGISVDVVPMAGGKKASATIITFKGKSKEFICNKTNAYAIALLLGSNRPIDWIGKRIQLVTDEEKDRKTRQMVPCLRVLGSPDASPAQADEYKRAWRGERKGGELCTRLKIAVQRMLTAGKVAPIEAAEEVEPELDDAAPEDDWSDAPASEDASEATSETVPAPAREPGESTLSPEEV